MSDSNTRKTPKEWIKDFYDTSTYYKWLNNITERKYNMLLEDSQMSWRFFIASSFIWSKSREGEDFWVDISLNPPQSIKTEIYYV